MIYSENLINYRITKIDKYSNYSYYKIDLKKIANYIINDYTATTIYKFINLNFDNLKSTITKDF